MSQGDAARVLLVDDDAVLMRGCERGLARQGASVVCASSAEDAMDRLKAESFDVIVSDISMPGMTGLELLRAVRAHDLDVPVILMTGRPTVESAARAVEYGAFRYLAKPVSHPELWETVLHASRVHRLARLKREALELPGRGGKGIGEQAALEVRFSSGMRLLWMAFQPIVEMRSRRILGYEALLRSDEPLMRNPADLLEAAERLGELRELGRAVRRKVADATGGADSGDAKLFVNLHAADLNDPDLYDPDSPLSKIAHRVILEVTERASLHELKDVKSRIADLKTMGFQIALDDLGAGYAGLTSFSQLEPDVAKLDMSLIRGINADPLLQRIVRSMKTLCDDLGVLVVAEGIETPAERDTLTDLGCDVLQGYLFAKPGRGFGAVSW